MWVVFDIIYNKEEREKTELEFQLRRQNFFLKMRSQARAIKKTTLNQTRLKKKKEYYVGFGKGHFTSERTLMYTLTYILLTVVFSWFITKYLF